MSDSKRVQILPYVGVFVLGLLLGCFIMDQAHGTLEVAVKNDSWGVMICAKGEKNCSKGTVLFPSKEECEAFVKAAANAQPNIGRSCHRTVDIWEIK